MKAKLFLKSIFAIMLAAMMATPVSASQVRDYDSNAIIYGGAYSISELNRKLNNGTGKDHQSSAELKDLFAKNGVYQKDFGQLKDGYVTKDNKVYIGNKLVASNVTTMGRHDISGSTRDTRFSYPIYLRHPSASFLSDKLPAFVSINYDGTYAYAIIKPCGNIVRGPGIKKAVAPTCTISASPRTVERGHNTLLTYSSTNATSASISGVGSVGTRGSKTVRVQNNTRYTMTVRGSGGSSTCSSSVAVTERVAPVCSIFASPETITRGESSVLNFTSTNATSASINSNIGTVILNGAKTVKPTQDTAYRMTVRGAGGTAYCSTTVRVNERTVVVTEPDSHPTAVYASVVKTTTIPAAGPAEAAAGALGITSVGGAAYSWIRSKKALLSAIKKIK